MKEPKGRTLIKICWGRGWVVNGRVLRVYGSLRRLHHRWKMDMRIDTIPRPVRTGRR
jgi:hypothetical protein